MDLRDYLQILRRRVVLVVLIVAIVAAVTAGMALHQHATYEAGVRLRARPIAPLSPLNQSLAQGAGEGSDLPTEAQLVISNRVADAVISQLHLNTTPPVLLRSVSASVVASTQVMVILAKSDNPKFAEDLANAFANAYLQTRRDDARRDLEQATNDLSTQLHAAQTRRNDAEQGLVGLRLGDPAYDRVKAQLDAAQAQVGGLETQILALGNTAPLAQGFGEIIEPADSVKLVRSRAPTRTVLFGGLVGFPLALAVVLLLESLGDSTVRTKEEAEEQTDAPTIGLVPFDPGWSRSAEARLTTAIEPYSPVAESYRRAAYNLLSVSVDSGARVILVTSPGASEGKSATAANLAVALSDIGNDALLIEANTRWPRAWEFVHGDPTPGLAEVLTGQTDADRAVQWLRPSLGFLASGTADVRLDLALARADLAAMFRSLRSPSTLPSGRSRRASTSRPAEPLTPLGLPNIIVDAAPVLAAGEVSALSAAVDGVVLVLRANVTTKKGAALAAEQIRRAGGRLLGVVLVGLRDPDELGLSGTEAEYRPRSASTSEVVASQGLG